MQISLKWVNELVNIETVDLDELINKLTLGGFEVEEILEVEIDNRKTIVLDISATANRSDSLSIRGLSLEIAALLNQPPNTSNYLTKNLVWTNEINQLPQNSLQTDECSAFIALTIDNLNNLTTSKWLKQKLIQSGLTPENNLIDFQNYIILETGYAFEFYDLDKIYAKIKSSNFNLTLTNGKNLKNFPAENDIIYPIDESILILQANDFPISIGGLISNKEVSYSNKTTSLLIEGSIFKAAKIRQQSRMLGLRTERSSRYEKALKDTDLIEACYRLVSLLRINNPNLSVNLHTLIQPSNDELRTIKLNYETIKEVLGPIKEMSNLEDYNSSSTSSNRYLAPEFITKALTRLQFHVNYDEKKSIWDVKVPSLRNEDIILEIDLIEEIGRIYGFNNFLTRLPIIPRTGTEDFNYKIRKRLTSCLLNLGLNELIQYSLVNEKTYLTLSNEIKLVNPLVKEYANLRAKLLPSLLKAIQENSKNDKAILEGFEYGHVFSKTKTNQVKEKEHIAGIFGGIKIKSNWSNSLKLLTWFEAKGRMEDLFQKLNLTVLWKSYSPTFENDIFHPYCTSEIYFPDNHHLGTFGQIHPIAAKQFGISSNIFLFEFDFELIQTQIKQNKLAIYQEYTVYPKIVKDLSFIIHNKVEFSKLSEILYLNGSKFLTNINLLDEYKGKEVPKDHTSLCLQFIFQSDQGTLQTQKVEKIIDNIKSVLQTEFKVILRE